MKISHVHYFAAHNRAGILAGSAMSDVAEEITSFQIEVARRWIKDAGAVSGHPPFEFFAYFSALNALYWLWAMLDGREAFSVEEREAIEAALRQVPEEQLSKELRKRMQGNLRSEAVLFQALVEKLGQEETATILVRHDDYVRFLLEERRRPIHRMDKRRRTDAMGDPSEGKKYLRWLRDPSSTKKLAGLASILYLIRCNLVHGSKGADVEDRELVKRSVPPLRSITEASLEYTLRCPPT